MEAKVAYFMYCSSVERKVFPGGNDIVCAVEPLSCLTPEYVPGVFSFSIVFSIIGIDVTKDSNTIRLAMYDANENIVFDSSIIQLPPFPSEEDNIPKDFKGINMSMDLKNVNFVADGVYYSRIECNGVVLSEHSIYVGGKKKVRL